MLGGLLPSSFLRGKEFLRRASPLPPLPTSHLLWPAAPSNTPFAQTHSPPLRPSGPPVAREPGTPASSHGSWAGTHPARHLRGHVRLLRRSSALGRARPRRARPLPALALILDSGLQKCKKINVYCFKLKKKGGAVGGGSSFYLCRSQFTHSFIQCS